jgi:hypothetical protein
MKSYTEVLDTIENYYDEDKKQLVFSSPEVKRNRLPTFESITTAGSHSPNSREGERESYVMAFYEPSPLEI